MAPNEPPSPDGNLPAGSVETPRFAGQDFRALREEVASHMTRIARLYGLAPLLGRLASELLLATEPLSLGDLAELADAAKSSISVQIRRLEAWGLVRRTTRPGDRRDYYEVELDPGRVAAHLITRYLVPEAEAGARISETLLRALDAPGPDFPQGRALETLAARAQGFAALTDGFAHVLHALLTPRGTLDADRANALLLALAEAATPPVGADDDERGWSQASPPIAQGEPA